MTDQPTNIPNRLSDSSNTEDVLAGDEPKRIKIRDALLGIDPTSPDLSKRLAQVYEGLVLTFNNKRNPDRIAQVSHSARELTSILPRYFKGIPILEPEGPKKTIASGENQRAILEGMLDKHPDRSSLPEYLRKKFVADWIEAHEYFHKSSKHEDLKNKTPTKISLEEFEAQIWKYEDLLYQVLVEKPFFADLEEIDKLLVINNPTSKNISDLIKSISQPEHRRYFFQKCDNPNWLESLKKIDAFSKPQEPLREGGYIRFLSWPESQYLSRIADRKPKEVYEIIKDLDFTNQSVLDDFVDAAIKSPPDIAIKYVELAQRKKWIQNPYNLLLPDKLADLMNKLADEDQTDAALVLARILFDTKVNDPKKIQHDSNESKILHHPDAKTYFDEWRLGKIIKEKLSLLARKKPVELFGVLASALRQAIELENRTNPEDSFYEYSHIWRPNLRASRHSTEDAKNLFLDGLVDLIEKNKDDGAVLKGFAENLKKHPWALFRRIEMLLYATNLKPFMLAVEGILSDRKIMIAYNLRREYLPLLGKAYLFLREETKNSILKSIEKGPNLTRPDNISDEQFARIQENWKALYLDPIKEHLPEKEKKDYEQMVSKNGEPDNDDGEIKTWHGGQSPISSDELSKLNGTETVNYFSKYKAPDDFFAQHSSGGLGMTFAGLVAEDPAKYIAVVNEFVKQKVRPIYFYHLIHGLKEALKKNKCFDWKIAIQLCEDIVLEQANKLTSTPADEDEQDWKSVRRVAADFIGAALGQSTCEVPISLKEKVWLIISNLAEDPEPTKEDEERDGKGGRDPMTLAINTTRGEAMHALINYGLWYARNLSNKSIEVKMPPEMEELLNKHLDPAIDPSLAIRSVYGWRLPNLFYLNRPWLEANKGKIFDEKDGNYFLAAWEGYLANNIIKEIFNALKDQYRAAIPILGTMGKTGSRAADIIQRLPQHLMVVYANETDHDDLIEYFFKTATTQECAEAINFVGRVILREIDGFTDKEKTKSRLAKLWKERISQPKENIKIKEIQEFGWWFKNSPMDRKATLEQTIKTLELVQGKIDVPYEIVEELVSYATEFPIEAIKILDLLTRADKERHEISYKKAEYREVLRLVKAAGNTEAAQLADALINHLGSLGFIEEFRDLIK